MQLTNDYIRGLVEGEGCFTFCTTIDRRSTSNQTRVRLPTFMIQMHERDQKLIEAVRDFMGLKNRVYNLRPYRADGYDRGRTARLMVRDLGSLKNIVIPFFYGRLSGNKGKQFIEWLEKIGSDPTVAEDYKLLYRLYKSGWFEKNPKYLD